MDLIPNKYDLGVVEVKEIGKNRYRGKIQHLETGCSQIFEYDNVDGPGIDQLSVPFSFQCLADYAYDMKLTKISEDDHTLKYGIHMELKD